MSKSNVVRISSLEKQLRFLAREADLEFRAFLADHYQFRSGTLIVNYWPQSKRKTAHVRDSVEGINFTRRNVSPRGAIRLATGDFS